MITKEWCLNMATIEAETDSDIEAGKLARLPFFDADLADKDTCPTKSNCASTAEEGK